MRVPHLAPSDLFIFLAKKPNISIKLHELSKNYVTWGPLNPDVRAKLVFSAVPTDELYYLQKNSIHLHSLLKR